MDGLVDFFSGYEGQKSADSVEKVGPSRLPGYWLLKTPFLRTAMRNLSSESSAQRKDFNLKRVLFCRGNHSRLFQQNRPIADPQRMKVRV